MDIINRYQVTERECQTQLEKSASTREQDTMTQFKFK
jgi:hypothetical protein